MMDVLPVEKTSRSLQVNHRTWVYFVCVLLVFGVGLMQLRHAFADRSPLWWGSMVYSRALNTLTAPARAEWFPASWGRCQRPARLALAFQRWPDGSITALALQSSSGNPTLDRETLQAATRWHFAPGSFREPRHEVVAIMNHYAASPFTQRGSGWWLTGILLIFLLGLWVARTSPEAQDFWTIGMTLAGCGFLLAAELQPALGLEVSTLKDAGFWCGGLVVGLLTMLMFAHWRALVTALTRWAVWLGISGAGLLLITLAFGREINGHRLTLQVGPLSFLTIEVVKVLFILALAGLAPRAYRLVEFRAATIVRTDVWTRYLGIALLFLLLCFMLLLMGDFGPLLLITGVSAAVFLLMGEWRLVLTGLGCAVLVSLLCLLLNFPAKLQSRLIIFSHPWQSVQATPQDSPHQRRLASIASGQETQARLLWMATAGGWAGRTLGYGRADDVPEVAADFTLAHSIETWGVMGAALLVLLLGRLVWGGIALGRRREYITEQYLAVGVALMFGVQAALTAGANVALLPVMGITFPFLSQGGTGIVMNFIALGVLCGLALRPAQLYAASAPESLLFPDEFTAGLRVLTGIALAFFVVLLLKIGWLNLTPFGARLANQSHLRVNTQKQLVAIVVNPRTDHAFPNRQAPWLVRGRLLDRRGTVLAETTVQGRRYQHQADLFELLGGGGDGMHTPYGLEAWLQAPLLGIARPGHAGLAWGSRTRGSGPDIALSIDLPLQLAAEEILRKHGYRGCIVAIQPQTGEILCAASAPRLSAQDCTLATWEQITNASTQTPPSCFRMRYAPASTFKTVIAAAARDAGHFSPTRTFLCTGKFTDPQTGQQFNCTGIHGRHTLMQALPPSCDAIFAQAGVALGWDTLFTYADQHVHLNEPIPLLPEEWRSEGGVPCEANASWLWGRLNPTRHLWEPLPFAEMIPAGERATIALARTSIGQQSVRFTPLQLAVWTATLANHGVMMHPTLLHAVGGVPLPPRVWDAQAVTPDTDRWLTEGMQHVMTDRDGMGHFANIPALHIAGKTGTAEDEARDTNTLFMGFAPADHPTLAVAVILEKQHKSKYSSAPVAVELLAYAARHRGDTARH